jgi:low affinity Fe/Cu permease
VDHRIVLISVVVAVIAVIGYLLVMRVFFRESKELDKKIDYAKMKKWEDDPE